MDEDVLAVRKRLETKIRETSNELKEFGRERIDQATREWKSEIARLDMRLVSLERLVWNRMFVFLAGFVSGLAFATIGLVMLASLSA